MSRTHVPPPFELPKDIDSFVAKLPALIDPEDGKSKLDAAVKEAYKCNIDQMIDWGIDDADKFLRYATGTLRWIPAENASAKEIYYTLCVFYFVLDRKPVMEHQTAIHPTSIDTPMTTVSQWICMFAVKVGDFMNTRASLTPESLKTFEDTPQFNMQEAWYPPSGFETFNQLFCRYLIDGARPIDDKDIEETIVWPADSQYDGGADVSSESMVNIKSLDWPIKALLRGSAYEKDFAGGKWIHAFLGPTDYHRQHAPVRGKVLEAKVIQGLCYLEVDVEPSKTRKGQNTLVPHRSWKTPRARMPSDLLGDPKSDPRAPDTAGYQFIQTRGCIIIETENHGKVAVLPIGMAYVSSVKLSVQDIFNTSGTKLPSFVEKGQEISCFQFGGSDIVLVFQADPSVDLSPSVEGTHYNYGNKLGIFQKS